MGWWTLGGKASDPVEVRVASELTGTVERAEVKRGGGETTVHLILRQEARRVWVVALVRAGMVKIMDETAGPYCSPCSSAFRTAAVEACGAPMPDTFAADFRARMAA